MGWGASDGILDCDGITYYELEYVEWDTATSCARYRVPSHAEKWNRLMQLMGFTPESKPMGSMIREHVYEVDNEDEGMLSYKRPNGGIPARLFVARDHLKDLAIWWRSPDEERYECDGDLLDSAPLYLFREPEFTQDVSEDRPERLCADKEEFSLAERAAMIVRGGSTFYPGDRPLWAYLKEHCAGTVIRTNDAVWLASLPGTITDFWANQLAAKLIDEARRK